MNFRFKNTMVLIVFFGYILNGCTENDNVFTDMQSRTSDSKSARITTCPDPASFNSNVGQSNNPASFGTIDQSPTIPGSFTDRVNSFLIANSGYDLYYADVPETSLCAVNICEADWNPVDSLGRNVSGVTPGWYDYSGLGGYSLVSDRYAILKDNSSSTTYVIQFQPITNIGSSLIDPGPPPVFDVWATINYDYKVVECN